MIEWFTLNKEAVLAAVTTLLVLAGAIVKLTASRKDDTIFNTIVGLIGFSQLKVEIAPAPVVEPTPEPKPEPSPEWPAEGEPKV